MRLIDAEMIKIPTSMMHNIGRCYMIRVEDAIRIITEQPTAFDKEKVIEELRSEASRWHESALSLKIKMKKESPEDLDWLRI